MEPRSHTTLGKSLGTKLNIMEPRSHTTLEKTLGTKLDIMTKNEKLPPSACVMRIGLSFHEKLFLFVLKQLQC